MVTKKDSALKKINELSRLYSLLPYEQLSIIDDKKLLESTKRVLQDSINTLNVSDKTEYKKIERVVEQMDAFSNIFSLLNVYKSKPKTKEIKDLIKTKFNEILYKKKINQLEEKEYELKSTKRNLKSTLGDLTFSNNNYAGSTKFHKGDNVGGDLLILNENSYKTLDFLLADICGKGTPAAVFANTLSSAYELIEGDLEEKTEKINDYLEKKSDDYSFATGIVGKADFNNMILEYCNAGHNPIYQVSKNKLETHEVPSAPLGLMQGTNFPKKTINANAGDYIVLYTDAFTEAKNNKGEMLEDKFKDVVYQTVQDNYGAEPLEIKEKIIKNVEQLGYVPTDRDDSTLLILKY